MICSDLEFDQLGRLFRHQQNFSSVIYNIFCSWNTGSSMETKKNVTSPKSHKKASTVLNALLIEDDRICRIALAYLLKDCGYSVDIAANGAAALDFLQKNTYSLVFADIGLPDISGIEIIKRLRGDPRHKSTLVIGQSAHMDKTLKTQCIASGCDAVLSKPVMQETLKTTLDFIGANKK